MSRPYRASTQFWAQGVLSMSLGIGISTSTCGSCPFIVGLWCPNCHGPWWPCCVRTDGFPALCIHGEKRQEEHRRFRMPLGILGDPIRHILALQERDWVMKEFKEGNSAAVAVVPARFPRPLRIQGIIKYKKIQELDSRRCSYLVGALEHVFLYVPCNMGESCPLTNSYFSRWLLHHQPVIL